MSTLLYSCSRRGGLLLFGVLLCLTVGFQMPLSGAPARPGRFPYVQPDGTTVMLERHGDEFFHWTTLAGSDQVVELDEEGFWTPVKEDLTSMRKAAMQQHRFFNGRRAAHPAPSNLGEHHIPVILVEFSDVHFKISDPATRFDALLNTPGYSSDGATGSVRDFYRDNSDGRYTPVFEVFGPVTLSQKMSYYGSNDSNAVYAVREGCQLLDGQIDFSRYDADGDGVVDMLLMYYAGYNEAEGASSSTIWPHQWEISSAGKSLTLDGTRIDKYACTNEIVGYGTYNGKMCGIGTACHEFGHAMGLPDFYDTDYETNGEAGGLYDYSTMCGGSYNNEGHTPPYFNIEERILLGWLDGSAIRDFPSSGSYVLPGIDNNIAYRTPTDMDGEYFLYECRSQTGWDKYIPQAGLLVYHVDKSSRKVSINNGYSTVSVAAQTLWSNWQSYNSINENGSHPCFYIIPAGSQSSLNYTGSKWTFPSGSVNYYTAKSWNGVSSEISLSNITYSSNQVSLYATVPTADIEYTVIANPGNGHYTAGDIFTLELVEAEARPVQAVSWLFDDEPVQGSSVLLKAGAHTVEAQLLLTDGTLQTVTLEIVVE